jgi:hypothetical protein
MIHEKLVLGGFTGSNFFTSSLHSGINAVGRGLRLRT